MAGALAPGLNVTEGPWLSCLVFSPVQAGCVSTAATSRGAPGEGGSVCCWLAGGKDTLAIQVFVPTLLLLPATS